MGVFNSCVTAFRKESWRSLRRISRTRKTVLSTTPAMRIANRMKPRTSRAMRRPVICSHVRLSATARAVRQTPRVMKNAMAPRRRVRFMLAQEYKGISVDRRDRKSKAARSGRLWREFSVLSGACRSRVLRVELGDLHPLGKAKLLHHPDAVVVHIELIPSESVPCAHGMCMV